MEPLYTIQSAEKIARGVPFTGTVYHVLDDEHEFLGQYENKKLTDIMREHGIEEGTFCIEVETPVGTESFDVSKRLPPKKRVPAHVLLELEDLQEQVSVLKRKLQRQADEADEEISRLRKRQTDAIERQEHRYGLLQADFDELHRKYVALKEDAGAQTQQVARQAQAQIEALQRDRETTREALQQAERDRLRLEAKAEAVRELEEKWGPSNLHVTDEDDDDDAEEEGAATMLGQANRLIENVKELAPLALPLLTQAFAKKSAEPLLPQSPPPPTDTPPSVG